MDYIELKKDEVILLEAAYVTWINNNLKLRKRFDMITLTNLRVHGRYKKSKGIFKDSSVEIVEFWLSDIKMLDGKLSVQRKWDYNFFAWILEIYTKHGVNQFLFSESSKTTTAIWISEIYKTVLGVEPPDDDYEVPLSEGLSKVKAGIKGITSSALGSVAGKEVKTEYQKCEEEECGLMETIATSKTVHENSTEMPPKLKANRFCSNCGTRLNEGSKFCHFCGAEVGSVKIEKAEMHTFNKPEAGKNETRRQEYAGTVLKCPNCGNVINSMDAVCSACGMHLSDRKVSDSVQLLSERLMEIENNSTVINKGGILGLIGHEEREEQAKADACRKKVTLINSFPLPNNVSEIYDFMMLAIANIDTHLSNNTIMNNLLKNAPGDPEKDERSVSNAWVKKMQQVYQKAQVLFPNDAAFTEIQNMYQQKMRELKM